MTVSSSSNRIGYTGNGSTTAFSFPYEFGDASDLKVYQAGTLKTITTHYTVSGGSGSSGTVTFLSAPATGESVVVYDDPPATQLLDYIANDPFPAESHEGGLDKLTRLVRRLKDRIDRAMRLADSDVSGASTVLPTPSSQKILGWNAAASALVNYAASDLATVAVYGAAQYQEFSGNGVTVAFTLSSDPGSVNNLDVDIGGVSQRNGVDFTLSGTTLTFTSAPPSGSNNIHVKWMQALPQGVTNANAVSWTPEVYSSSRTVESKLREHISVKDFGAVCDGSTDDTVAVQRALDYCVAAPSDLTPVLEVPGLCKVVPPLYIDRAIGRTDEFRIVGVGKLGGFYVTDVSGGTDIFSSRTAHTTAPVSEWVTFERINFRSGDWNDLTNAIDGDKFLRVKFQQCHFLSVRIGETTNYVQTWHLIGCNFRQWKDWLVSCKGMYDVKVIGCVFEDSVAQEGKGFYEDDPTLNTGTSGCSWVSNLFEGCYGPFIDVSTPQGLDISGNYFESNSNANIKLIRGTVQGVSFTGNYSYIAVGNKADANFYDVVIGETNGFFGAGNYCDGRLYDFTGVTNGLASVGPQNGDRALLAMARGSYGISGLKFLPAQSASADPNTLDDYEENDSFSSTISGAVNCTLATFTSFQATKIGRQVTILAQGTFSVTAGATLTGFTFTLPYNQAANTSPGTGAARIDLTGVGVVADNSTGSADTGYVYFPGNQIPGTGARNFSLQYTYNAAT